MNEPFLFFFLKSPFRAFQALLTVMYVEVHDSHSVHARVAVDAPSVRRPNGLQRTGEVAVNVQLSLIHI